MTKTLSILMLSLLLGYHCQSQTNKTDFNLELVKLVLKYADGEVSQIYIPDLKHLELSDEDLKNTVPVLATKLIQLGFKITQSKYLGYTGKTTSTKFILQNDICLCTIYRVYEPTKLEREYRIKENIDCILKKSK